ncbi:MULTISPECIES: hypothetical protein [Cyanophyceae]|uniref:hypothetical protein n=1 Tax=Cyanophyceae TaxID=3028117 RepID=UPI00168462B9|nr:hypothetical protein [Trichocoleus sp. FACHB-40]MBD2001919.1 hypothetical protein [Trichocoleus sp. FACHB-40]
MVRQTRNNGLHSDTLPRNTIIEVPDDESWADKYNDDIRDTIRDTPRDTIRDTIRDTPRDTIRDTPRDTIRDTIRDTPSDTIRDRPRISSQPTRIQETVKPWIDTPNRTTRPRSLPNLPWVEIVEQQKGLTPISNTGFYRSPDEPADPRDCNRYPDSPYCGGIPLDFAPISLDPAVVVNSCGQVVGIQINPVVAFVKLPPVQLIRVDPNCDPIPEPPPPPPPPPPTKPTTKPPPPPAPTPISFECFEGTYTFENSSNNYASYYLPMIEDIENFINNSNEFDSITEHTFVYDPATTLPDTLGRTTRIVDKVNLIFYDDVPNLFVSVDGFFQARDPEEESGFRYVSVHPYGYTIRTNYLSYDGNTPREFPHIFVDKEYFVSFFIPNFTCDNGEPPTPLNEPPPPPPPPDRGRPSPPPPPRPCCMSCCPSSPNPTSDALLRLIYMEVLNTKAKVNALTERIETIEENVGDFPRTIQVFDYDETTKGVQPVALQVASIAESIPVLAARTEKVAKLIGVDEFPAQIPESLITKDEGWLGNMIPNQPVYENNIASVLGRVIKYVDEIAGQFEIPIEIKDADPTTPGAQPVGLKISNIAEGLGELILLGLQTSINSETLLNMATRNLLETGQIKQMGVKIHGQTEAITSFLGFNTKDDTRQMPLLFTIGKTSMDELLQESYVNVTVPEFDEKLDLKDILADLTQSAAITRAVHWRKINMGDAVNMKDQIMSLWRGQKNTADKINETADDLDSFINSAEIGFTDTPGITDNINPYGRPYDQRPRIREIGVTSDTQT